jgi:hypothetical protein
MKASVPKFTATPFGGLNVVPLAGMKEQPKKMGATPVTKLGALETWFQSTAPAHCVEEATPETRVQSTLPGHCVDAPTSVTFDHGTELGRHSHPGPLTARRTTYPPGQPGTTGTWLGSTLSFESASTRTPVPAVVGGKSLSEQFASRIAETTASAVRMLSSEREDRAAWRM